MNKDNWATIEEYFHKALELPVESRLEFINQAFADDHDTQQAIISLLKHTEKTQALSQIVGKITHSVFDSQQDLSGTMAGAYQLISCIETGGMGAIYIAERADNQYEKKVAVKLIKSMSTNEYLLTRFKEERQILANLEHNNITRLVDGGTTEAGVPFLVMEYVEGMPIDQYCETHQLTLKQRLSLFLKVCDAIQYAHQNLVVHCDLKPENILVSQDGEPKVMDFGISHLLNKTELSSDAPRLLTIQYASPEQISGASISVSSDVYSLGAVLFKMLTGVITFPIDITSKEKILDYIMSGKIIAASEQASKSDLGYHRNTAKLISADLDAIIAKALQASSKDRYSSAVDIAEDIKRYLDQYPVLARSASWHHKSKLFFRRNALSTAMGIVLGVSILSASATIWYQSTQVKQQRDIAQQQRDKAQTEQKKAQAVTKFITDMFRTIDPDKAVGKEITVFQVLQSTTEKLDNPEQSELKEQPLVMAEIRKTIGDMYWRTGNIQESVEQLEIARSLYQQNPNNDADAYISTLNALSNAYSRADRQSDRREILETIVTQARDIYGEQHRLTIGYTLNLGGYYSNIGQPKKAIDIHLETLKNARLYLGEKSDITALALASLGNNYLRFGDNEASLNYFHEGLSLVREVFGNQHSLTIYLLERLATIYNITEEFVKSKPYAEELIEITISMLGPDHQDTHRAQALFAQILNSEQRYSESLEILNQSLLTLPSIIGENHHQVISTKAVKVETLAKLARFEEAIMLGHEVVDNMIVRYGEIDDNTLLAYQELAAVYQASGAPEKAHEIYTQLLPKWQEIVTVVPANIKTKSDALYLVNTKLTELNLSNNQSLSAIDFLKQAIAVTQNAPELHYPNLAENIRLLTTLMQQHTPDESIQPYIEYLSAIETKAL